MKRCRILPFPLCLLVSFALCAQPLDSTSLPIILIETNGQVIDFQKIEAGFRLVANPPGQVNQPGDPPAYEGPVSIRLRGNFSAWLPQQPYAFETLDPATGLDTSVSLLEMPEEEDWILLANWNDKSLVRNPLLFHLARSMGHWAPHTRHVEVLLDGNYEGIYVFCEKIKRDKNRVAVAKLGPEDNALPALSGGYVFKHDYGWEFVTDNWHPQNCADRWLNFEMVYPKIEEVTPAQFDYLQGYLDDAEEALFSPGFADPNTGYRQYLDLNSWVDYFLLSELSGNVDAYKKSMFFHKDRGGLLKMGPVWDFDWAMKFLGENGFPNGSGWLYKVDPCSQDVLYVPYFLRLMEDTFFQQQVCERWQSLRGGILDTVAMFAYVDSTALALDEAQARHFQRWQCLGYDSGAPEAPPYPTTYAGEVEKLKKFLRLRTAWMDANLPFVACQVPAPEPPPIGWQVEVLPNVGAGNFVVRVSGFFAEKLDAALFDAKGSVCARRFLVNGDNVLDLENFPAGAYFLHLEHQGKQFVRRVVVR